MKVLLILVIGILLWNNNEARQFTSDSLQQVSDFIEPNTQPKLIIRF